MGIVYKVLLPDGRFYIGHTIQELSSRLASHLNDPHSTIGESLRELKYKLGDTLNITEIIHDDWDSEFFEISHIYRERNNSNILNKRIRKSKPSYNNWLDHECGISLTQYDVSRSVAYRYSHLLKEFGGNHGDLLKELIRVYTGNENENKKVK